MVILLVLACSKDTSFKFTNPPNPDAPEVICEMQTWYADVDGDGYGDADEPFESCEQPYPGADNPDDCNDEDSDIYPGAPEHCDGRDHNCDGISGNNPVDGERMFRDADGDGYGDPRVTAQACPWAEGYTADHTDCNDANFNVHPGALERCEPAGLDEDCDELVDDADWPLAGTVAWFPDVDQDTYGDAEADATWMCVPPVGTVDNRDDCNDLAVGISPASAEVCADGVDDDCSGQDDCPSTVSDAEWAGESATSLPGAFLHALSDGSVLVGAPGYLGVGGLYRMAGPPTDSAGRLTSATSTYVGETTGDLAGSAAAGCDLDGDGSLDILVGAPGGENETSNQGIVAVWLDARTGRSSLGDATGERTGTHTDEALGTAVGCGLDANGRGVALLGAPGAPGGGASRGEATVTGADDSGPLADELARVSGIADGDALGAGALDPLDYTGDGVSDLIIGAPGVDRGGLDGGAVYRFDGGLAGSVSAADADAVWVGLEGDAIGTVLAGVGDLNGDGRPDLAMGAPDHSQAYVSSADLPGRIDVSAATIYLDGPSGTGFGTSLSGGLDLNGDGRGDLVAGAPKAGEAWVYLGPLSGHIEPTGAAVVLHSTSGTATFGAALLSLADPTDGFLVGDPDANTILRIDGGDILP